MNKEKIRNLTASLLLIVGSSAMIAECFQWKKLKGLALATQCAPYTKVFGLAHSHEEQQPFETFASTFTLHYTTAEGVREELDLTPEAYSQLKGPYNRRNVYGAVLAYGPALPPEMRQHALTQALTSEQAITDELGIPESSTNFTITITPKNPNLPPKPFILKL